MSASGNGKDYGNGIGITDVCEVPLRRKCLYPYRGDGNSKLLRERRG